MKIIKTQRSVEVLRITLTSEEVETMVKEGIRKKLREAGLGCSPSEFEKAKIDFDFPYHEGNSDTTVSITFPEDDKRMEVESPE